MDDMAGRTPYLCQRVKGSWEYHRPIATEYRLYFEGRLNRSAVLYYVFRDERDRPEKNREKILPAYYHFHANVEDPALVAGDRHRVALHRARQAHSECLHRKLQRPLEGRALERDLVRLARTRSANLGS